MGWEEGENGGGVLGKSNFDIFRRDTWELPLQGIIFVVLGDVELWREVLEAGAAVGMVTSELTGVLVEVIQHAKE